MKISFARSGGVAGLRLATTVDSRALEPGHDGALRALLAAHSTREPQAGGAPARDRFRYRLTIEDDGKTSEVDLDESEVPAELQAFLDWLTERARTQLRQA